MTRLLGILVLATTLGAWAAPARAEITSEPPFPAVWLTCKADTECQVVKGVCGAWDCVNAKGVPTLLKLNPKMEKDYGCGGPVTPKPKPKAVCTPKGCRCQL
jgi:hypothetical protein